MSANVRCAGHPPYYDGKLIDIKPCGWKGERFSEAPLDREDMKRWWPDTVAIRTRKPCPRCGGRVELTGERPA